MLVVVDACKKEEIEVDRFSVEENYNTLSLSWFQNDSETQAEVNKGLIWCFSFLGAELPTGCLEKGLVWETDKVVKVDITQLGFTNQAQEQLRKIVRVFKESEEFQISKTVDLGRFVVTIFNNSNHYYKIVGTPTSLENFTQNRIYLPTHAAIVESAVAFGERIIQLPNPNEEIVRMGYLALEVQGSVIKNTHITKEFEVMDIMPNGQFRFGVYDLNGKLIQGADPNLSAAGKPTKCLWCHETNLQKGFAAQTSVSNYYSPIEFDSIIDLNFEKLKAYRGSLVSEIDYNDRQGHTELEKLYIRFMEPSIKRLSGEWGIPENEVEIKLSKLQIHLYGEFPEMGNLYYRSEVDNYAPFIVIPVSKDAREVLGQEPDYL